MYEQFAQVAAEPPYNPSMDEPMAKAPAPVHLSVRVVAEVVGMLSDRVDQLGSRLSPVLGPGHPSSVSDKREGLPATSPLTVELAKIFETAQGIEERLSSLIDRLEV